MRTLNLGILAHVDAGKTTLTERVLFTTGAIDHIGSVDAGTTQTDSLEGERVGLGAAGVDALSVVPEIAPVKHRVVSMSCKFAPAVTSLQSARHRRRLPQMRNASVRRNDTFRSPRT